MWSSSIHYVHLKYLIGGSQNYLIGLKLVFGLNVCNVRARDMQKIILRQGRFNSHEVTLCKAMSNQCDYSLLDILCCQSLPVAVTIFYKS